jgi:hypothetical protein
MQVSRKNASSCSQQAAFAPSETAAEEGRGNGFADNIRRELTDCQSRFVNTSTHMSPPLVVDYLPA